MKDAETRNHLLGTSSRYLQPCIRASRFPRRRALKRHKTRLVALSHDEIRRKTWRGRETEQRRRRCRSGHR